MRLPLTLLCATAIAACQPGGPAALKRVATPKPTQITVQADDQVKESLAAPAGASTLIEGRLEIDAGYAVAAGGASIIANNAGNVVALAEQGLIANNGGNLISDHGAGLVSDHGGGLIGKVKLISDHGVGLIGKVKWGLLAASEAPKLGDRLPAAGMLVGALGMADGKPVPIGVNGKQEPVYAIYTNAGGTFTLHLPPEVTRNVRLVAFAPTGNDPRLGYDLLTAPASTASREMSEDTALVARYVRISLTRRLAEAFALDGAGVGVHLSPTAKAIFGDALQPALDRIHAASVEAGVPALSPDGRELAVQAFGDAMASYVKLDEVQLDQLLSGYKGPPTLALPALTEIFKALDAAAAKRLQADPQAFATAAWTQGAEIVKPADLGNVIVQTYLSSSDDEKVRALQPVLAELGLPDDAYVKLKAGGGGVFAALMALLIENGEALDTGIASLKSTAATQR
ncbi:MAG: hypothetical protein JWM80_5675 [Cyanobacteria bacterium RYN_339]|nr:hypothetical protein [Cyanobacteria bacterium RYN_339]